MNNNQEFDQNFNFNKTNNNNYSQARVKLQEEIKENNFKPNIYLERKFKPDRTISYYYGKEFLSDAILKDDNFELPFHKIILCSASNFLNDYFTINPDMTQKSTVILPEVMKSSFSQGDKRDCLDKILKYCYFNQDIKSIESDITQNNCFTFLELAHCLQIKSLCVNLEDLIIKEFLKDDNMIKISEESNIFELDELYKECSNRIKRNLWNISNKNKVLTELKYETFKDIISADEIDVEQEKDIADLVIEYIKSRRDIPDENLDNPEEKKNMENIDNNENNEQNNENKNNEEPPKNEEKKEDENNENIQNEENKNIDSLYTNWKKHLNELETKLKKKKLTSEEEKALVLCIRFSYLSHTDLISLTTEPLMENYKDLILQGLSARLNNYENTREKKALINLEPRHYLRARNNINNDVNQDMNNYNNNNENNQNINDNFNNNKIKSVENLEKLYQFNKFNDPRNFANSQPILPRNNNFNENILNNDMNNFMQEDAEFQSNYDENNFNYNNNSNSNYLGAEVINIDEINSKKKKMAIMTRSSPAPRPPQDPKISQNFFRSHKVISSNNPIFKYTYDFDENGALYYLGTKGKKYPYRNPHELNLVTVFASSISKGQLSDFVGRNLVNLRTENEENSFIGVDLGENRTLVPNAYSIRNRNSSTHVMLCWNLEASNDRINFEVLDTRIFSNVQNPQIHQKLERERNLLKEPGCTSTWGISKKVKEKYPNGFRYFLIKQIDKNSNGSYNLTNSGFELYGEGKGSGWIFN